MCLMASKEMLLLHGNATEFGLKGEGEFSFLFYLNKFLLLSTGMWNTKKGFLGCDVVCACFFCLSHQCL